ncbi:hypothetical protein BDAP_000338 [Binucleata daphniae]
MQNITNGEEEKKRYNEKQVIKDFLNSQDGINILLEKIRCYEKTKTTNTKDAKKPMIECIDELIDFYVAWVCNCPSKIMYNKSHYSGFKHLEKICDDKEVKPLFDYLFK